VIAKELGAVAEVVKDTGGGITYQTEDELLAAMKLLQTDRQLRDELGARGYHSYISRYTEELHIRAYLDAIAEAEEARRAAG
jgi:glycosyltransferase involved in cell wall biosynthesis